MALPAAPAFTVTVVRWTPVAVTERFLDLMERLSLAVAESLRMVMPKAPPRPTLLPAAAASELKMRVMLLEAETVASPVATSVSPSPMYASTVDPVTPSASAGVTEVPPAEPALPVTVALPDWAAATVMLASACGAVTVLSAMEAMVSMPVTSTAMPAPTPTPPLEELVFVVVVFELVALAAAFASATVLV